MLSNRRVKLSRGKDAVSEVIANILVLTITVTLFAGIFFFLNNIPGPQQAVLSEFTATIESGTDFQPACGGESIWLNITHRGGPSLGAAEIDLFTLVDQTTGNAFKFTDGGIIDGVWSTGESWSLVTVNTGASALGACVGQNSIVSVTIIDTPRTRVVWTADVLPKVSLFGPQIFGGADPQPAPIAATFMIWARVIDLEGVGIQSVTVDSVDLNFSAFPMTYNFARDRWEINPAGPKPAGRYSFDVVATNLLNQTTTKRIYFVVGVAVASGPDLQVDDDFISFSVSNPVRGTVVTISSVIFNLGATPTPANVTFYLDTIAPARVIGRVNITTIAAAGGESAEIRWVAAPAGPHLIWVKADTFPSPAADADPSNNQDAKLFAVLPRILLVDDDQESDSSPTNSVSFMKAALYATDFPYDLYVNGGGTGPDYDTGNTRLKDYDVVIWMTGRDKTVNTLTENDAGGGEDDIGHLTQFLDSGGRLWLISEGVADEALGVGGSVRVRNFLETYMRLDSVASAGTLNSGTPTVAQTTGTPLWDLRVSNYSTKLRWAPDGTDRIATTSPLGNLSHVLRDQASPGNLYAINWSAPAGLSELRTVFFSMSFNFLKDPGDHAQVTYRVLLWLAGIQKKLGRDLAISDSTITPPAPRYQQDVTLNVTVRNNGDQAETGFQVLFTDVFLGVESTIGAPLTVGTLGPFGESVWVIQNWRPDKVGLHILRAKVDWNNKIPETNENNNEVSNLLFSGEVFVGYNILVVDDDNQDGVGIGLATYNSTQAILDDFGELNVGLARPVLEHDYFHVPLGQDGPSLATMQRYNAVVWNTGTATPSGASFLLTANDRQAIQDFLRSSGGGSMLYLIAPNIRDEIALQAGAAQIAYNDFMRDNFGVGDMLNSSDPAAAGAPVGSTAMYGTLNDDVSHGMLISFSAARGNGASVGGAPRRTALAGGAGNSGLFHADAGDDYWTISTAKYYGTRRYDSTFNFRAAWLGFSPAYLTNGSVQVPRSEVSYMVLHWMGVPDPRGNAKISPPDIFVSAIGIQLDDEHLEIQRSYILKIQVRNTGQKVLNGLAVRYLDSGTIIATESASVGASSVASNWQVNDGRVVVEAIWTPLFAGVEDIEVVIDPDNIIAERTKLDNNARQSSRVFFFYDDLESGDGKWKHEGTIARINGENPLDFIPLGVKAETDIRGTFQYSDYSATAGIQPGVRLVQNFSDWSHSDPNSFWFAEAPPKPLDVVFVIDRTGSMGFSSSGTGLPCDGLTGINSCKWQQTKAAYFSFLDKMKADNPKHRSALITFSASTGGDTNPGRVDLRANFGYGAGGTFLDRGLTSDITLLKAAFNLTSPTGGTNLFDAAGFGTWWLMGTAGTPNPASGGAPTARPAATDADHFPAIIWQTDGGSNSDVQFNDYAAGAPCDGGAFATSPSLITLINYYRNTYSLPAFAVGAGTSTTDACPNDPVMQAMADAAQQILARGCQTLGTHTFCRQYFFGDPTQMTAIYDAIFAALKGGIQTRLPGADKPNSGAPGTFSALAPILQESFEASVPPAGWSQNDITGTLGNWIQQSGAPAAPVGGGASTARFNSGTSLAEAIVSTRMCTPAQSFSGQSQVSISLWVYHASGVNTDPAVSVQVRAAAGACNAGTWTTIATIPVNDGSGTTGWSKHTLSLANYDGQPTVVVGFLGSRTTNSNVPARVHVHVDLVEIFTPTGGGGGNATCAAQGLGPACAEPLIPRRWAVTPVLDLRGATSVRMTMWHRFNMLQGQNGGLVQVGVPTGQCPAGWRDFNGAASSCSDNPTMSFPTGGGPVSKSVLREADGWHWNYIKPLQPYNSNMNLNKSVLNRTTGASATADTAYLLDEDGFEMVFAWSATSGQGKFEWEYAEFDLTRWAGLQNVRLNLSYFQHAGGSSWGWWVDDVTVVVTRGGNSPSIEARDRWVFTGDPTQPGNEAFFNDMTYWKGAGNVSTGGLDNSLFSTTIALTSAKLAYLQFDTRYNVNSASGNPPDSVRVEISDDNGNSWAPINLGIRMDNGVSGGGGAPAWVSSSTLTRLETNLSGWAGEVIRLRFRAVTATDGRLHFQTNPGGGPQNYGVWFDNIRIYGESAKRMVMDHDPNPGSKRSIFSDNGQGSRQTPGLCADPPSSSTGGLPSLALSASRPTASSPSAPSSPWSQSPLAIMALLLLIGAMSLARKKEETKTEAGGDKILDSHPLFASLRKKGTAEARKED